MKTYEDFLNIIGYTEDRFIKEVVNSHEVKHENKEIELKKSSIHGVGCFTTKNYVKNSLIGKVLNNNYKTELGRYVNHSSDPNVYLKDNKFFALKNIKKSTELLVNYFTNLKTITKKMELNLINKRENFIRKLSEKILENIDHDLIKGDGKNMLRESEEMEIIDDFTNGVYIRRMDVKKGTIVSGCIHNESHSWFLIHGTVLVADKNGLKCFKAPYYTKSNEGDQRIIEVLEDAIWVNTHSNPDNGRDIKAIEKRLFSINKEEYKKHLKLKKQ